jgi:hypothetical protein
MRTRMTILFLFVLCLSFSQTKEQLKEITDKVIKIDGKTSQINRDSISTIQASGKLTKKTFLFFNKTIGSYHFTSHSIKNDTLVLKVEELYSYKNGINITETYYFSDNELIKYHYIETKNSDSNIRKIKEVNAFFKKNKAINKEVFENINKTSEQVVQQAYTNKKSVLQDLTIKRLTIEN